MSILKELLETAVAQGASDIHITPDQKPFFRVSSGLKDSGFETIGAEYITEIVRDILPPHLAESFETTHEADFSLEEKDVGRFRVNTFLSQGMPALALRHVKTEIPTFEGLRLPEQLRKLARASRGIIMLTGTTGSGKSTTLAAIIGEINRTERRRIITVEDPIEYLFADELSVITQREVGLDTISFEKALEHVMRQDPDVILIGEMRDQASIRTALMAAETGHLVLTTLHAGNAAVAIPRILETFPMAEQEHVRLSLTRTLEAVICQRLIPDTKDGLVPSVEIMVNTPIVRKLLEKSKLDVLPGAIETGRGDGMQSFNQSIYSLIKNGLVTEKDGLKYATNPESLRMNLQGIFLDEDKRILQE